MVRRMAGTAPRPSISFRDALRFWTKLGFINFGGPTAQIAILHEELVERKRWISEDRFLHALNFCMLLPGPEAQQLATYIGWLLHGTLGGIAAGALFVVPSMIILFALSAIYAQYGSVPWVAGIFEGLQPAVVAIIAAALLRISRRALRHPVHVIIAAAAFLSLFTFHVPFPIVIGSALAIGFLGSRWRPQFFTALAHRPMAPVRTSADQSADPPVDRALDPAAVTGVAAIPPGQAPPTAKRFLRTLSVCFLLWIAPLLLLLSWRGLHDVFVREAVFFTQAALITFGGAYAVLPYVAEEAVQTFGWLTPEDMIIGLGLAETTPGPLIMVLQFVGFFAGWNEAHDLGWAGAAIGALTATYFTFLPSFALIFLFAPWMEGIRRISSLAGALAAVTAAVVGVMLNLALWFAGQVFFTEQGPDILAIFFSAMAFLGIWKWGWSIPVVLAAAVAFSMAARAVFQ
jgi:chromate transporter